MELGIWQGDWTLPSVDLTCLQVMVNFLKEIKYIINTMLNRTHKTNFS